ncbi:MAG: hypothetical protein N2Z67_09600 [Acetobacteraceae bacterium]|nr:hypothetical protein [Acetobacteraceae bacterium]
MGAPGCRPPRPPSWTAPPRDLGGGLAARELAHPITCAVAYRVSREAAAALRAAATPVRGVADWPCDTTRIGAWIALPRPVRHADLPSVIGGVRDPRALGLLHPKRHPGRFLTRDYRRRCWRKIGSEWLAEAPFARRIRRDERRRGGSTPAPPCRGRLAVIGVPPPVRGSRLPPIGGARARHALGRCGSKAAGVSAPRARGPVATPPRAGPGPDGRGAAGGRRREERGDAAP